MFMRILAAFALFASSTAYADVRADRIIDQYVQARGGQAAMERIVSLTYVGFPDHDVFGHKRTMIKQRAEKNAGNYLIVGCLKPSECGYAEGIDRDGAWEAGVRSGRVRRVDGSAASALRNASAFYDLLVEAKERGAKIVYAGEENFLKHPSYRLHYSTPKGSGDFYVDKRTHLLWAERTSAVLHARGEPIPQLTLFSDWRPVSGVLFPYSVSTFDWRPGKEMQYLEAGNRGGWDAIIANFKYPESYFSPRDLKPTPVAKLVLDMFEAARTQPIDRVIAMYDRFKQSPDFTKDAAGQLNWLGYELLKADNLPGGIAILELAAHEFPDANAFDSLGDAYLQAGRQPEAIVAYRHALTIDPNFKDSAFKLKKLGVTPG
jgi:hypothetical protein